MNIAKPFVIFGLAASLTLPVFSEEPIQNRGPGPNVNESVEVSDHVVFNSTTVVNGATILVRDFREHEIDATITTSALEPDTAYSIWWAVFNYPKFCIEPFHCSVADLGASADPRVKPSVFWGGGFIADAYDYGNTAIRLATGRTARELFAGTRNYGLQNLKGAEIHVVLRSHGLAGVAGTVARQVATSAEACPPEGCANVFASIHVANRQAE